MIGFAQPRALKDRLNDKGLNWAVPLGCVIMNAWAFLAMFDCCAILKAVGMCLSCWDQALLLFFSMRFTCGHRHESRVWLCCPLRIGALRWSLEAADFGSFVSSAQTWRPDGSSWMRCLEHMTYRSDKSNKPQPRPFWSMVVDLRDSPLKATTKKRENTMRRVCEVTCCVESAPPAVRYTAALLQLAQIQYVTASYLRERFI